MGHTKTRSGKCQNFDSARSKLKFEFFDSTTRKRLRDPDTIVCVSPTIECPTMDNASVIKTGPDFKNPYIVLFKELLLVRVCHVFIGVH